MPKKVTLEDMSTTKRVSNQRRRYLAARRRGLSQSEAMKEAGVSRSTAWRHDKLFHQEEAERAALRDRVKAGRGTRESDDDAALREAQAQDISIQGSFPMPPWAQGGTRPKPSVEEQLPEDGSYPSGLLERRQRTQETPSLPSGHPMLNRRAVTILHGQMPSGEADMSGRLSRPFLPEDPPNMLGGAV